MAASELPVSRAEASPALPPLISPTLPQNETRGIDVRHFGELLMVSGVVLNEDVSCFCITHPTVWLREGYPLCCGAAPLWAPSA